MSSRAFLSSDDFSSTMESSSSQVLSSSSIIPVLSSSSQIPSSSSVNVSISYGTLTDARDGQAYKTVVIGTQTWMAENLAYLPSVNLKTDNSNTVVKYYVYDYSGTSVSTAKASSNYITYGALYNWTAADSACPSDWHLPTNDDWNTLIIYVGGSATAGTYLKATSGWNSVSGISNLDTYGFSALPGGCLASDFRGIGLDGIWWTAQNTFFNAFSRIMNYYYTDVSSYSYDKDNGYSVRCVKDYV